VPDQASVADGPQQGAVADERRQATLVTEEGEHLLDLVEVSLDGGAVGGLEGPVEAAVLRDGDTQPVLVDDRHASCPGPEGRLRRSDDPAGHVVANLQQRRALETGPDRLGPGSVPVPVAAPPVVRRRDRPDPLAVEEDVEDGVLVELEAKLLVVDQQRRARVRGRSVRVGQQHVLSGRHAAKTVIGNGRITG
jgi:hypothetical protein